ncbi:MAG: cysteine hydrolase [Nitrososphaeraceae archaeon]|nr:cysteine hydrolase [Nitrososphaeraceae archaeon]
MQKVGNKIIYNTIEEIMDPSHTALVVWDVQNMLVNRIFNKEEFTSNLSSVIDLARRANVPIFFTRIQMLPIRFESSARLYTLSKLGFNRIGKTPTKEELDFAIKPKQTYQQEQQELQEGQQNETVIDKHTASIFIDTGFEHMLQSADIITVIFTGIATEYGIESSARDASSRGFYSVVVSDCVSSPDKEGHNRSLENMKKLITITSSKEIESIWSK